MKKYILIIVLLFVAFSCELDVPLKSSIATERFFKTEEDFDLALNGVYEIMGNHQDGGGFGTYYRGLMVMGRVGTDEGYTFPLGPQYAVELSNFTYTDQSLVPKDVWEKQYQGIGRANTVISKIQAAGDDLDVDQETRNRIEGEAKFMRAFYYFQLVRFFGAVPVNTLEVSDVSDIANLNLERQPIEVVYAQIVKDLMGAYEEDDPLNEGDNGAEDLLPNLPSGNLKGRATKYVAKSLLAKVYLQMSGYPMLDDNPTLAAQSAVNAAKTAKDVIDNGPFALLDNYEDVFKLENEDASEHIFSVQYNFCGICEGGHVGTWDGPPGIITYSQTYSLFRTYQEHFDSYDPVDPRRDYNVVTYNVTGFDEITGEATTDPLDDGNYYAFKWRHDPNPEERPGGTGFIEWQSPFNFPLIRFSDILLTYAEAQLRKGGDDGTGLTALNQVRRRAYGVSDTSADLATYTLDDILNERKWELCYEGQRWHDLVRHGKLIDAVRGITSEDDTEANLRIQENKHELFPIPLRAMQINGYTENNPGY